ncbi:MAG: hypothetical protein J5781_05035, partial [Clostridia bacterium]|nr:hypothetical protein [Clostridia bacterium]
MSIFLLFLFGCLITQNKPELPATMFFVLLLIVPMFMINQPFIMGTKDSPVHKENCACCGKTNTYSVVIPPPNV